MHYIFQSRTQIDLLDSHSDLSKKKGWINWKWQMVGHFIIPQPRYALCIFQLIASRKLLKIYAPEYRNRRKTFLSSQYSYDLRRIRIIKYHRGSGVRQFSIILPLFSALNPSRIYFVLSVRSTTLDSYGLQSVWKIGIRREN